MNLLNVFSEELDQDFFLHVLQLMENPPSIQFEDEVVEPLVHFILSYNLHLTSESNPILGALAAFGSPKVFTEQIMVLINRGSKCWFSNFLTGYARMQ